MPLPSGYDLPPELAVFSALLDAQPGPVRDAFNYCMCLLIDVEAARSALLKRHVPLGKVRSPAPGVWI